jgi:hypothetical protein
MKEIDNPMEQLKIRYEQLEKIIKDKTFFNAFSVPYHFKDREIRDTDYPNAEKSGVYIFFNRHSEIRYIGMAFFEPMRKRLNELIDKKWIGDKDTEYLRTLGIPEEMYSIIPMIESILLKTYDPPLNKEMK